MAHLPEAHRIDRQLVKPLVRGGPLWHYYWSIHRKSINRRTRIAGESWWRGGRVGWEFIVEAPTPPKATIVEVG